MLTHNRKTQQPQNNSNSYLEIHLINLTAAEPKLDPTHSSMKLTRSQENFVKTLVKHVSGCKTILDAGCGSGWVAETLIEQLSATVTTIDLKTPFSKCNVEFSAIMDVNYLGFSKSFDLVIAKDIIEHLSHPRKAMEQFSTVLKDDGKIIITVPSPQAPFLWDDYTHIRPFTKASLGQLLADSGFDVIFMKYQAAPTPGAALLRLKGVMDYLADKGLRKGNLFAVAKKTKSL
jgi:2-polyprenyl-3-methyl-5-hydroxy-6-metoxy-1,4-benzoquinol methylase